MNEFVVIISSWVTGFIVGVLLSLGLSFSSEAYHNIQKEAVERGHAEWQVDASGETTWRWKGGDR